MFMGSDSYLGGARYWSEAWASIGAVKNHLVPYNPRPRWGRAFGPRVTRANLKAPNGAFIFLDRRTLSISRMGCAGCLGGPLGPFFVGGRGGYGITRPSHRPV